jgi:hypothetical protein
MSTHLQSKTKHGSLFTSAGNFSNQEIDRRCEALVARERKAGRTPDLSLKVRRVDPSTLRGKV